MVNLLNIFAWTRIDTGHIMKYQPNGSMCQTCKFLHGKCDDFDFSKMPVYSKIEGGYVVLCTEYVRMAK